MKLVDENLPVPPVIDENGQSQVPDNLPGALPKPLNSIDAPDDPSLPTSVEASGPSCYSVNLVENAPFPDNLPHALGLFRGTDGRAYSLITDKGNWYAIAVGSKALNVAIRKIALQAGYRLRNRDLREINEYLEGVAETSISAEDVWNRLAPIEGGIEIDLGDDDNTRVRVTVDGVKLLTTGSHTRFCRSLLARPLLRPAEEGDVNLLRTFLNMHAIEMTLLIAWLTYVLAHPKQATANFPILVLFGDQGAGKTVLCQIILAVTDPNQVGVQILPRNPHDLAIAATQSHVLCFDNVRRITPAMADAMCTAATGGSTARRRLYTDADISILNLHAAIVINGIHAFIDQPDLAQRCLPIRLRTMQEDARQSEAALFAAFERDLPKIFRGLLELIAEILKHLPTVTVTHPERMIDFSRWLAAFEKVRGASPGVFQQEYSRVLREAQLDSLVDNVLASAVLDFVTTCVQDEWRGSPSELLGELNLRAPTGTQHSRDWPRNAIAFSKRLSALQGGLLSQGIKVTLGRGKYREITITKMEASHD